MSLAVEEIPIVGVRDPRTVVGGRSYVILKGPKTNTFTPVTTTNISSSSITYSVKTPSPHIFVNKYLYHLVPIRLQLNSNAPNANNLLRAGYDAPRAFPLAQSLSNVTTSFNGSAVSVELGDYISALIHYNTPEALRHKEYSSTPSYLDQSQNYYDLQGSTKSPLSFYGDGYGDMTGGRAGFPFKIVSNTASQAIIDMVVCEPLFVSPYHIGSSTEALGGPGIVGMQNLDFQFNFYSNAWARMWSHDGTSGLNAGGLITSGAVAFNNFTSLSVQPFSYGNITSPQLLFEYLTPSEIQIIPRVISYPYYRITRYPTDITAIAPGASFQVTTQNITIASIPSRIYIFCKLKNQTLQSACTWTDSFTSIEGIQVNWANNAGQLSSATKNDLFNMSIRNGCQMNWSSWSGNELYKTGSFTNRIAGLGSILCIRPGIDIGLGSDEAPGVIGNYNLQMTINMKWPNTDNTIPAQDFTCWVLIVEEGVATTENLQTILQVGVLTPKDVLDSKSSENYIDYEEYMNLSGGDFLSGLKRFGENVYKRIHTAWNKYGRRIAPVVEALLPSSKPIFKLADKYLTDREEEEREGSALVGGERRKKGGALVGGRMISKRSIMNRLA